MPSTCYVVTALLLGALAHAEAADASYGNDCADGLDCGKGAPHCQVYLKDWGITKITDDKGNPTALPETKGFCSECTDDCHCGVGECKNLQKVPGSESELL